MHSDRFFQTTRGKIVSELRRRGSASAADLASQFGLSPNAVRQQLTILERDGLVAETSVRRGPTKPTYEFSLTSEADRLFPQAYDKMLSAVLREVRDQFGPPGVAKIFDGLSKRAIDRARLEITAAGPEEKVAQLTEMLQKNGVDPKKDIKLVEVGFAVSEDALRQGRVDAVNMNQPFAAHAEAKGGTRKLFSLNQAMPNIVHILEACRADFVDKNPELVRAYVRDITSGMRKALANREETLKVVSEVLKAPISVLDTYLLKDNDFGRDPGAAPNFGAIQKMLDIYAATGMLPKMDVAQFKHPTIVAPLQ